MGDGLHHVTMGRERAQQSPRYGSGGSQLFVSPPPPHPGSRQVEPYDPGVGKMSCGFLFWKPNHLNAFLCVEQTVGVQNDSLQPAAWRGS